jgi:hypothetical protein
MANAYSPNDAGVSDRANTLRTAKDTSACPADTTIPANIFDEKTNLKEHTTPP